MPAAREYTPVKDKAKESEGAPCKVVGDNSPATVPPKTFDEIKARIESGDIVLGKDSPEDATIRKASPSIAAEWAGY